MKTRLTILAIAMAAIMALGVFAATVPKAQAVVYGPRIDQLLCKIYPSSTNEFTAFEAGDIDIIDTPLTPTLIPIINATPGYALDRFYTSCGATAGYYGHRTVVHVLNVTKYSIPSYFDLLCMNLPAVGVTGGNVNFGFASDVEMLNVIYSTRAQDWQVLGELYDTLIRYNPLNLLVDMPWMASGWTVGTWTNPTTSLQATKVRYTLNSGIKFINPIFGTVNSTLTTDDIAFSLQYTYGQAGTNAPALANCYANVTGKPWSKVGAVPFVTTTSNTVTVYYNNIVPDALAVEEAGSIPIIPMKIFQNIPDATGFYPGGSQAALMGSGPFYFSSYNAGVSFLLLANRNFFKQIVPNTDTDPTHIHIDWGIFKSNVKSGDWTVNVLDLIAVASNIGNVGPCGGWIPADVNKDKKVNLLDIITVATDLGANWLP